MGKTSTILTPDLLSPETSFGRQRGDNGERDVEQLIVEKLQVQMFRTTYKSINANVIIKHSTPVLPNKVQKAIPGGFPFTTVKKSRGIPTVQS